MFTPNVNDTRRVQIIDVSGLFYKYAYGGASALSSTIKVDGVLQTVDTTLPTYVIKQIHRWAKGGVNPTVVCFDGLGCSKSRKAYFTKASGSYDGSDVGYKGSRSSQDSRFYDGINLTMNLLIEGGVTCLKADGYEADDLVFAAVQKAKEEYPDLYIDVMTGDADLTPLVDDQVSVFLDSRKVTWAETKELEKLHRIQLRPSNFQEYMEGLTAFKNLAVPYNTVILAKCLRGDKSDDIKGYPKFTPTKYRNLIAAMKADNVDMANLFRYDEPVATISYRGTEEPIPEELIESTPKEQKMIKYSDPKKLIEMCDVLKNYLEEDIVDYVKFIYRGINLNGAFTGLPEGFNRRPAKISSKIDGYLHGELAKSVGRVQINLPVV